MKVLVTGAAGFIGSHTVDALVARGANVIGLDSLDTGVHRAIPQYLNPRVEYCFADLRTWRPDSRFAEVEAVVHLAALGGVGRAAREPANIIEANCVGTARLAEATRQWPRLRRIVLGSSFSVYGSNYKYHCPACSIESDALRDAAKLERGIFDVLCPKCGTGSEIQQITEETAAAPLETYGASKYMQELCFRGFSRAEVCILRFSSVYGPRLRLDDGEATIIARLAGWIRAGTRPRLFEDGRQIRDWVYVMDVVDALAAAIDVSSAPALINVCSGVPVRLLEACEHIARAMGISCEPEIVGGYRTGDMRHCLGNPSRFSALVRRKPLTLAQGAALTFRGNAEAERANAVLGARAMAD